MNKKEKCKWYLPILTIKIILGICLIIWIGILARNDLKKWYYIGKPTDIRDTISIQGEGKVIVTPDIVSVDIGIRTKNKTVANAQKENTQKMNIMIDKIKKIGIKSADIKTDRYNIFPQYDYPKEGKRILSGYQVSQSIHLKIRSLDSISQVLAVAGRDGANEVGGLNFTIDKPEALLKEAREKALDNAREKARALAKSLGVKLGRVVNYSESKGGQIPQPIFARQSFGITADESASSPTIEPGSQDVKVFVTIEYEIL